MERVVVPPIAHLRKHRLGRELASEGPRAVAWRGLARVQALTAQRRSLARVPRNMSGFDPHSCSRGSPISFANQQASSSPVTAQ